jgi:hypothetical protein
LGGIYGTIILGSLVKKLVTKGKGYEISWSVVLVGVILMVILKLIPVVGWFVGLTLFVIAIGSVSTQTAGLLKTQK